MNTAVNETVLDFSRYEFKYVLSAQLRHEVESELGYFMQYDPFVAKTAEHQYTVRSLYFDDRSCSAYYDKIDGIRTRSKFRIRTYATNASRQVPQFLELKGRHDNRVFKHRVPLPTPIDTGSTDRIIADLLSSAGEEALFEQFRYRWYRHQIRPVALVDYRRRPYVSKYDAEFRVTFDETLRGMETAELFPRYDGSRSLVTGFTVMEVKFGHRIPAWFHRIIQSYELRRRSISKICEAMTALELASDLQ